MKTYMTKQAAEYGLYTSFNPMDVRFVGAAGEPLEGLDGASYRRVPTLLALGLAPVLGAVFVISFPLLILGAVALAAAKMLLQAVRSSADEHAWVVSPRWEPVASYLTKHPKKADASQVPAELQDLNQKVQDQRAAEEKSVAAKHEAK